MEIRALKIDSHELRSAIEDIEETQRDIIIKLGKLNVCFEVSQDETARFIDEKSDGLLHSVEELIGAFFTDEEYLTPDWKAGLAEEDVERAQKARELLDMSSGDKLLFCAGRDAREVEELECSDKEQLQKRIRDAERHASKVIQSRIRQINGDIKVEMYRHTWETSRKLETAAQDIIDHLTRETSKAVKVELKSEPVDHQEDIGMDKFKATEKELCDLIGSEEITYPVMFCLNREIHKVSATALRDSWKHHMREWLQKIKECFHDRLRQGVTDQLTLIQDQVKNRCAEVISILTEKQVRKREDQLQKDEKTRDLALHVERIDSLTSSIRICKKAIEDDD